MERYVRNDAASFVAVSPIEVTVQGSPLDGYALVLRDETRRGLAKSVIDALANPVTLEELHALVSETGVTTEELTQYLDTLCASGAVVRSAHADGVDDALVAFNRFGRVPEPAARHPLTFVGDRLASALARHLGEYGRTASQISLADLTDLAPYARVDRRDDGAEADTPCLVVAPDETSVADLHAFNERAVGANVPVLYLAADGVQFAIGPFVDPGRSACFWEYERLHARTLENYTHYAAHANANGNRIAGITPRVTVDALTAAATPFLMELELRGTSSLAGQVIRGHATTVEHRRHSVMRLPRCPVCMPTRPLIRNPLY